MKRVLTLLLVALLSTSWAGAAVSATGGSASLQQNNRKHVSGIVTDKSGAPIPGASVMIPGTTTGTVTGVDGRYGLRDCSSHFGFRQCL